MRIIRVVLAAAALIGAFTAGRLIAVPPAPVDAQMTQLSHFRCYTSEYWKPSSMAIPVNLKDQFTSENTQLMRPQLFCTPVTKTLLKTKPMKFPQPADHLTCYATSAGKTLGIARQGANQLGPVVVRDLMPRLLCVPTWKNEKPG